MSIALTKKEVAIRAKALRDLPPYVPILEIAFHWLQILAALSLYYWYPSWLLGAAVILFVSARQYGLAILLHDAQHTLLASSKAINNWIATWLIAAPLGSIFSESQTSHLDHHQHLGDAHEDPDYSLYCFGTPNPKRGFFQLLAFFIFRVAGGKLLVMLMGKGNAANAHARDVSAVQKMLGLARKLWPLVLAQTALLAAFTVFFGIAGYFLFWFLPLATLAVFYNDFRTFCEHSIPSNEAIKPEARLMSYVSNPVERFFFAPNHMNYHAEHHLFPYVPHLRLPALRKLIKACPDYDEQIQWKQSYVGHLLAYVRETVRLRGPAPPARAMPN